MRRLAWAATCDPAIITLAKPRLLRCSLVLPSNAIVRLLRFILLFHTDNWQVLSFFFFWKGDKY